MQGDAVEHLDLGSVPDDQALDDVEAVQLRLGRGNLGQIPAAGRRRPTGPAAAVQRATAGEDAVDGPQRWQRSDALLPESLPDSGGPDGSQVAVGQLAPSLQHQVLHSGVGAAGLVRRVRAIRPVHAIQALAFGPLDPVRDSGDTNAEAAGDDAQGLTASHSGYHGSTPLDLSLCLLMGFSLEGSVLGNL